MRAEVQAMVEEIRQSLVLLAKHIDLDASEKRLLAELNARVEDPDLWNDSAQAQKIMQERSALWNPRWAVTVRFPPVWKTISN